MRTLVLVVIVTAACGRPGGEPPRRHGIGVHVVHADGSPAAGAFLLATLDGVDQEYLLRADATGVIELAFNQPAAIAVASSDGFAYIPRWEPRQGERFVLDADCVPVTGEVIDALGRPVLPEVVLRLRRYSDQNGDSFFVSAVGGNLSGCVPPARYSFSAEGGGYVAPSISVQVTRAQSELPRYRVWESALVTTPAVEAATASLRAHSVPTSSVDDLMETFKAARLVGCGEANHGSAELYRMRKDLLATLANRLGTRDMLLEAGIGEVLALDHYLQTGEGDLAELIAGLDYWLWDTEEFTDVVRWIRERNASVPEGERIHVAGVDVQTYSGAWALLRSRIDEDLRTKLVLFDESGASGRFSAMTPDERAVVRTAIDQLHSQSGDHDTLWWATRALQQYLQLVEATDPIASDMLRDRLMANNVLEAIGQARGGPAMFWAHTGHVAREPYDGIPSVGMHLAEALGASYVTIGYLTGTGRLRAWDRRGEIGVIEHEIAPPPTYAVEAFLSRLEWPAYYVDLHGEGAYRRWFEAPRYFREVGAGWPGETGAFRLHEVVKAFDLIGFARRSDATHPTPTGERRAKK